MKRIISISICMVFLLSASIILPAPEEMGKRWTFKKFEEEVRLLINIRNENLVEFFNESNYRQMALEFRPKTNIVTHDGNIIPGRDSENYWRKVGDELNGTNLDFKAPHLELMEIDVGPEPNHEEFDFIALEITKFSFDVNSKKYKGYIDPVYRHKVKCIID